MAYRNKLKITNISDGSITIEITRPNRRFFFTIKAQEFLICNSSSVSFEELAEWEDKRCFKIQQYPEPVAEIVEVSRFELMEIQ